MVNNADHLPAWARDVAVPHIDQYFGVWAIEERRFRDMVRGVQGLNLRAHIDRAAPHSGFDGPAAPRSGIEQPAAPRSGIEQPAAAHGRGDGGFRGPITSDGVAIIPLSGTLMKFVGSMVDGTSTVRARRELRAAVADDRVRSIVLVIDSPGGTVSGTDDLAMDIAAAAKQKPVHAYIEDLGASAAYWAASAASSIFANRTALIGSIGVFAVLTDFSGEAEKLGIKVHVVRTGEFKGAGVPGTAITDEHLIEAQRLVDGFHDRFLKSVAEGRGLSVKQVRLMADGRVHLAADAVTNGMIDGIKTFDEVIAGLSGGGTATGGSNPLSGAPLHPPRADSKDTAPNTVLTGDRTMSATQTAVTPAQGDLSPTAQAMGHPAEGAVPPHSGSKAAVPPHSGFKPPVAAASYEELKGACVGASSEFLCSQLEHKATVEQARSNWMADQQARMAELEKKVESQQEKLDAASGGSGRTGVAPVADGAAGDEVSGDAATRWNEAVAAKMKAGMTRPQAVAAVVHEDPELHAAYIEEANSARTG